MRIEPQPGPQSLFCASPADIGVYGGAAGSGKSYALLLEAARNFRVRGYAAMLFRRTKPELRRPGGLWSESTNMYLALGGQPKEQVLEWRFPSGAMAVLEHLQHEKDVHAHQGGQYPFIGFDELTHFTGNQFWYLTSRNRSTCGVRPYIRATTNPDPDSFVRHLIDWWIGDDGYPIDERSGKLRWFVRVDDDLIWSDSRDELAEQHPDSVPRSFTFVAAKINDNPALLRKDPSYLGSLMALHRVERERLLYGNWNVRPSAGDYFQPDWFDVIDEVPEQVSRRVRGWDKAATEPSVANPSPSLTAGVRISRMQSSRGGGYVIEDVVSCQKKPAGVDSLMLSVAKSDPRGTRQAVFRDPGQAGVVDEEHVRALLEPVTGKRRLTFTRPWSDKETAAGPLSADAEHGRIAIVRGPRTTEFLQTIERFPDKIACDYVDASVLAHHHLAGVMSAAERMRALGKL